MSTLQALPKWLFSSVAKHFSDNLPTTTIVFIEGQHCEIRHAPSKDKVEIRMDGPYMSEVQRSPLIMELTVEINTLLSAYIDESDLYRLQKLQGEVLKCFTPTIKIYKYGDGDDELGCLSLKSNRRGTRADWIQVTSFGQIEKDTKLQQSTIEAHYSMRVTI